MGAARRLSALAAKCASQARLAASDPEAFARNIAQYTHRARYVERLTDMPPPAALRIMPAVGMAPTLNVLLPAISPDRMTGGPNTALLVGAAFAEQGTKVRFVPCDEPFAGDEAWFWEHLSRLTGHGRHPGTSLSATGRNLAVGPGDRAMATFWTTAYDAQRICAAAGGGPFLYLIQDFEPGFYPWSSKYAMALETYSMDFHPIVNQRTLAAYLASERIGRFADGDFAGSATVFEPAVDARAFRPGAPGSRPGDGPLRILAYARPTNPRNLLGMMLEALAMACPRAGCGRPWEVTAIGSRGSLPGLELRPGMPLLEQPWRDYASYARSLQQAHVLVSPMLSPHTGYPTLEMAACGGISVTTAYADKTPERLAAVSPAILGARPTSAALAAALRTAARMADAGYEPPSPALPPSWHDALRPVRELALAQRAGTAR